MKLIEDHCPHDEPIMIQGWIDCLRWALTGDGPASEIRASFESDTGKSIALPATPFDRMVDAAVGYDGGVRDYFEAFVPWFNVNVWGDATEGE